MKKAFAAALSMIAALVIATQPVAAQWVPIGPPGGVVSGLAVDPRLAHTLYAATPQGGLFKSSDGGATWVLASSGLDTDGLTTVAASPRGVLFAAAASGIFRSADHAASWQRVTLRRQGVQASQFAFDPGSPQTIYAAGRAAGVYRSNDGGTTWVALANGLSAPPAPGAPAGTAAEIHTIAAPQAGVEVAGGSGGLFRSTNGGASWQRVSALCAAQSLGFDPAQPQRLYAGCASADPADVVVSQVLVSSNEGRTWAVAGQLTTGRTGTPGTAVLSLAVIPHSPVVFAGTGFGLFVSRDSGRDWQPATAFDDLVKPAPVPPGLISVGVLALGPTDILYAGTGTSPQLGSSPGAGVVASADLGTSWTLLNNGLTATNVRALADDTFSGNFYAATSLGVFRTRNAGAAWRPIDSGLAVADIKLLAVWAAPDGGTTGTIPPGTPPLYAVDANSLISLSLDAGNTWTTRSPLPGSAEEEGPLRVTALAVDPLDASHILVGVGPLVYSSHDGGINWGAPVALLAADSNAVLTAIAFAPGSANAVYAVAGSNEPLGTLASGAVWRSDDSGATWTAGSLSGVSLRSLVINPAFPDILIVGGDRGTVEISNDGGSSWTLLGFPGLGDPATGSILAMVTIGTPSHYQLFVALGQPANSTTPITGPLVWSTESFGTNPDWAPLPGLPPVAAGAPCLAYLPLNSKLLACTAGGGIYSMVVFPPEG